MKAAALPVTIPRAMARSAKRGAQRAKRLASQSAQFLKESQREAELTQYGLRSRLQKWRVCPLPTSPCASATLILQSAHKPSVH